MNKTVYFLGAGATRDVCENAPLNNNLVKKVFDALGREDELWEFVNNLYKDRLNPPADNQIWNLFDYLIQQGKSASPKYNIEQILNMRNRLLNLVVLEFKKSLDNINTETYRRFVLAIQNLNTTIISTNYDIVVDNALAGIGCFKYGAKIRHSIYIPPPQERDQPEERMQGFNRPLLSHETNLNNGSVSLLKIHGSLNWLYCQKCDEIDLTTKKKGTENLFTTLGVTCINKHCTNKYEALLITPTMFKDYENRFFKETWSYAEKALIEADKLVFVGYALKDEDYQIRCLLMKALLNKTAGYSNITVVEKKPDNSQEKAYLENNIRKKYQDLYGEVDFKPVGFTEYVNALMA